MIDRAVIALVVGGAALAGLIAIELVAASVGDGDAGAGPVRMASLAPPSTHQAKTDNPMTALLAQPLFSPTRRPPDSPPGSDPELSGLRLTGIVIKPDRRIAIFTSAEAKVLERAEGETLNEWRLERISAFEVSLSGPAGSRTLEPKPDPNRAHSLPRAQSGQAGAPARPTAAAQPKPVPKPPPLAGSSEPPPRSPPANPTRAQ